MLSVFHGAPIVSPAVQTCGGRGKWGAKAAVKKHSARVQQVESRYVVSLLATFRVWFVVVEMGRGTPLSLAVGSSSTVVLVVVHTHSVH